MYVGESMFDFSIEHLHMCTLPQVDAQTHYEAERVELTQQIAAESALVRGRRLSMGFLSFTTERDTLQLAHLHFWL